MARWPLVLFACGLTLAAAAAVAQECPEIVAVLPYGEPDVVAVDGFYAYLGIGRGLLVVDQSDPTVLRTAARLAMPGTVRGIAVDGGRAYLTLGEDGVLVVDVSDPTDPRELQAIATPGTAQGVKVAGGLVFVASGSAGLCAISPGSDPPMLGCIDTPQDAREVDVVGALAFVADGPGGLVVVEVADPTHMALLGSAAMEASAVEAQGNLAFVACGDEGLRVVNVSQPSSPVVIGELDVPGAEDLDLDGNLVVMAARYDYPEQPGLRVIDVSTPSAPVHIGSLSVSATAQKVQVAVHGDHATLAGGDYGVSLVELSTPAAPVELGWLPTGVYDSVEVESGLAVLSEFYGSNPALVDLSRPDSPRDLSTIPLALGWPVALSGTWLYVATAVDGSPYYPEIQVFDLALSTHPIQVAALALPRPGALMTTAGNLLHVIDDEQDHHLIDVATPCFPMEVGIVPAPTPGWGYWHAIWAIAATPGFVYRGGEAFRSPVPPWRLGWFEIIDVSDPAQPSWITPPPVDPYVIESMRIEEGNLLVEGTGGPWGYDPSVGLYDLTDPSTPLRIGGGETGMSSFAATHHGQLLFLSSSSDQLVRVIDLYSPWDPAGIAEVSLPAPHGLATLGRYLLVVDMELGLVVLDTTCVGGLFSDGFESGGTGAWSEAWP